MGTVAAGDGFPVAILNRNEPAFYCVPAKAFEAMMDRLEDIELNAIADARKGEARIRVNLDEYEHRSSWLPLSRSGNDWTANTREQFRKKLKERCENPRIASAKLRDAKDRYKIKLKSVGYRLVYEVEGLIAWSFW